MGLGWMDTSVVCQHREGLTQPLGGCRRMAGDDEVDQDRDDGKTSMHRTISGTVEVKS